MTPVSQPTFESILRQIVREEIRAALLDVPAGGDERPRPAEGVLIPIALTPTQVSALLGVSEQTLYNWRNLSQQGSAIGPPSFKVGRLLRYDPDALGEWLAQRRSAAEGSAAK